jgi:hypothetical protein
LKRKALEPNATIIDRRATSLWGADMDQIIRRARLPERPAGQLVDIGIEAGSIVAIDTHLSTGVPSYDAAGHLVCGGLIESHIHLDKGRLLDFVPAPADRQVNPVRYSAGFKSGISTADIYGRAERTLRESLLHGTTRIIENNKSTPSLNTLHRIAKALDTSVAALLQDGSTVGQVVQRKGERQIISETGNGGVSAEAEVMIPFGSSSMLQAFVVRLEPGLGQSRESAARRRGSRFREKRTTAFDGGRRRLSPQRRRLVFLCINNAAQLRQSGRVNDRDRLG